MNSNTIDSQFGKSNDFSSAGSAFPSADLAATLWHDMRQDKGQDTRPAGSAIGNSGQPFWLPPSNWVDQLKELIKDTDPNVRNQLLTPGEKNIDIQGTAPDAGNIEKQPASDDLTGQRARLTDLIDKNIPYLQLRMRLQNDMESFEKRTTQLQSMYKLETPDLSDASSLQKAQAEVARTYDQVAKLLESSDNPDIPIDEGERVELAEEILHNAAEPTSIAQGNHNTCNVTTVEFRTYTRAPSKAASLVVQVATTGQYTAGDGTTIDLLKLNDNFIPHDEAKDLPTADGKRGFASQLFQTTAVNLWYAKNEPDVHYEQDDPGSGKDDTGERLFKYGPSGEEAGLTQPGFLGWLFGEKAPPPKDDPELDASQIATIGNAITGENDNNWVFTAELDSPNVVHIKSEEDFNAKLADAKAHGRFPIVVAVHCDNEPFFSDNDGYSGKDDLHVVSVTDYNPGPPPKVDVDNQWGSKKNHLGARAITASELYLSMRPATDPHQLRDLVIVVSKDRENGDCSMLEQLELLRREKLVGLSESDYQQQLLDLIKTGGEQLNSKLKTGSYSKYQFEREVKLIKLMMKPLDKDSQSSANKLIAQGWTVPLDQLSSD